MNTATHYTPLASRDLVFLDTETSGLDADVHEILDFAAIRISPDLQTIRGKLERKCTMQWPERATREALDVNKYDAREWAAAAQPIRLALVEFSALVGGFDPTGTNTEVIIAGHNPSFDWDFIRVAYKREELPEPKKKYLVDTGSIAWPLLVKGHFDRIRLETLCSRYGLSNTGAHRAMADVIRTIRLYAKLMGMPPAMGGAL